MRRITIIWLLFITLIRAKSNQVKSCIYHSKESSEQPGSHTALQWSLFTQRGSRKQRVSEHRLVRWLRGGVASYIPSVVRLFVHSIVYNTCHKEPMYMKCGYLWSFMSVKVTEQGRQDRAVAGGVPDCDAIGYKRKLANKSRVLMRDKGRGSASTFVDISTPRVQHV